MSNHLYRLERVDTLFLPDRNVTLDMSAAAARNSFVVLPDGYYRSYGVEKAPSGQTVITKRCTLSAATPQALLTALLPFKAKKRSVVKIYRRRVDGVVEWTWAEFSRLRDVYKFGPTNAVDLDFGFTQMSTSWYGARHGPDWLWNDGTLWDSGAAWNESAGDVFTLLHGIETSAIIGNGGNLPVDNAILKFTAGSAAVTGIALNATTTSGEQLAEWTYSGTLAPFASLVIDAGSPSATISTTLTLIANTGDTALEVVNSTSWVVGRSVDVYLNNDTILHTIIATIPDTTHITVATPLPSPAFPGNVVAMSAYPDLTLGPTGNHRLSGWFRIAASPEFTTAAITVTSSQNVTLTVRFSDAWEN